MPRSIGWNTPESNLPYALAWEQIRLPLLEQRATWSHEWDAKANECRIAINVYQGRLQALEEEAKG